MIPYEELVVALQAWRAKQGLPISQMSGQLAMPPAAAAPAPAPAPTRAAPPAPPKAPPPGRAASPAQAAGPAGHDELDVDSAMLEEAYEPSGGDFAMNFDNNADGDDATAIGGPPTDPNGRGGGGRKPGW